MIYVSCKMVDEEEIFPGPAKFDNPFAFIYLYNKAAKKDDTHPAQISEQSIHYLKTLESKYK